MIVFSTIFRLRPISRPLYRNSAFTKFHGVNLLQLSRYAHSKSTMATPPDVMPTPIVSDANTTTSQSLDDQAHPEPKEAEYASWTNDQLIARVLALERTLHANVSASSLPVPTKSPISTPKIDHKPYNPARYVSRRIALKFAYFGASYNGFEHHVNNKTPLPTIEEEIWKALVRTRLIAPPSLAKYELDRGGMGKLDSFAFGTTPVDWEGCEYSKCGRTDRGVSAFGQVIGVKVRSLRKQWVVFGPPNENEQDAERQWIVDENDGFDVVKDELNYLALLNRVLPPTIRMLGWCPNTPANFDARFSCKEREYRYFFTQPAYLPLPGANTTLDIDAMREGAKYLLGSHDFRNMCKIDPSKQIDEFIRNIRSATIEKVESFGRPHYVASAREDTPVGDKTSEAYCIRVSGSAFLWHQVRCMVAVLFLIGQGLEKPEVIKDLLDVEKCPSRPTYEMADDKPLVLWDCRFSATIGKVEPGEYLDRPLHQRGEGADELDWIYAGSRRVGKAHSQDIRGGKWNRSGIMEDLWRIWRAAKMEEILAAQLLDLVAFEDTTVDEFAIKARQKSVQIYRGEDNSASTGAYVPIMKKERALSVKAANARYLDRKGPENPRIRRSFRDYNGNSNGKPAWAPKKEPDIKQENKPVVLNGSPVKVKTTN